MRATARLRRFANGPRDRVRARSTRGWPDHSRLLVVGDRIGWSLDEDARALEATAARLRIETVPGDWVGAARRQSVFHQSRYTVWSDLSSSTHRVAIPYLHGRPGTHGVPDFDRVYEELRRNALRVDRVQVTHAEMRGLVLEAGVPEERVFTIPIGIDIERFPLRGPGERAAQRTRLGLPHDAFLVGSFQKDGVGWGEGLEPKLVKGPDVLVETVVAARRSVPELHVLLTGPARGYVKRELARHGVPTTHLEGLGRDDLSGAYHALDAYLVSSRQEGGPKGPTEAMASGVPVVSTRVGQAQELIESGVDGFLAPVGDVEMLAEQLVAVAEGAAGHTFVASARARAESIAYEALDDLWADFMDGFVACRAG